MLRIGEFASLARVSPRTLRHYAALGLVTPTSVDRVTGYRYYELGQLVDLQRVVALRDLGFGLEAIRELRDADGDLSVERLRGMLDLRRAELAAAIAEQSARLEQVAALLDDMEKGIGMRSIDVTLRTADRLRMAATDGVAPGYGHTNLGPVFDDRLPVVWEHLRANNVQPGISCAYFEWPDEDGRVLAHVGFDIGSQTVADTDDVRVVELEPVQVAAVLHRGPMSGFTDTFLSAVHWIDSNGYEIAERSRELYHKWTPDQPQAIVVELQIPVRLRQVSACA
jgi:DNA-binding transcriptional MerR regulator/effector-binding domain-containing protein